MNTLPHRDDGAERGVGDDRLARQRRLPDGHRHPGPRRPRHLQPLTRGSCTGSATVRSLIWCRTRKVGRRARGRSVGGRASGGGRRARRCATATWSRSTACRSPPRRAQITAVLGPNGAGKTSTIEVCEGYRRPTRGTVRVLGLDPAATSGRWPPGWASCCRTAACTRAPGSATSSASTATCTAAGPTGASSIERVGLTDRVGVAVAAAVRRREAAAVARPRPRGPTRGRVPRRADVRCRRRRPGDDPRDRRRPRRRRLRRRAGDARARRGRAGRRPRRDLRPRQGRRRRHARRAARRGHDEIRFRSPRRRSTSLRWPPPPARRPAKSAAASTSSTTRPRRRSPPVSAWLESARRRRDRPARRAQRASRTCSCASPAATA